MDKPSISPCKCPCECDIWPSFHIFIPVGKILAWVFSLTRASQFSPPCLLVQELKNRMSCIFQNSIYSDIHTDCSECLVLQPDIASSSLLFCRSLKKHSEGKQFRHEKPRCTIGCRHSALISYLWKSIMWCVTGTDVSIIGLVIVQRNGGFVCNFLLCWASVL